MSRANNYPRWIRHVLLAAAILCLLAGVAVGWISGSHRVSVLAWGSGVWVAAQGLLTLGDITLDDEDGMKSAWEAVTKPVVGLVGISVFGYAAGAAGEENNATLLVGILLLVVVLYVSAKVVQKRGAAPSPTHATGQP